MSGLRLFFLGIVITLLSWLPSVDANTIIVSPPPTGAAVVHDARFQNVFVFAPTTPGETWDQHITAFFEKDKIANPGNVTLDTDLETNATSEAINGLVSALTESAYFSSASQYNIASVNFDGGITSFQGCNTHLLGSSPSYFDLTKFYWMRNKHSD